MTEWIMLAVCVALSALCAVLALALRERSRRDATLIDRLADKVCVMPEQQLERIRDEANREAMAIYRDMAKPAPGAPSEAEPLSGTNVRSF